VEDLLYFNGIDATSGEYLLPPISPSLFAHALEGATLNEKEVEELKNWFFKKTRPHMGLKEGDPIDLGQAGWGAIFASDADPAIRVALKELLDWRKEQATRQQANYYHEFIGESGYQTGETKLSWLARHGMGPGPAEPEKVPYYLLLVGDPGTIPYRFQIQLDIQYATGRLYFENLEEYAAYAHSVVEAERTALARSRTITFFGVSNPDDPATRLSATELVKPLSEDIARDHTTMMVRSIPAEDATKSHLANLIGGEETPAFLFTASHGMAFPNGHPLQFKRQGALLTQDWPGPQKYNQPIPEDFYFSADDVPDSAQVFGMLAFFFACYGAGTPQLEEFAQAAFKDTRATIAPRPFIAGLPNRLLSHPNGSAMAVIGHVDRAWGYSFYWGNAGRQLAVFESALNLMMKGYPVGAALDPFNIRYAELSSELNQLLEDIQFGKKYEPRTLAGMWTANNDARNYVVVGDPAVHLMIAAPGAAAIQQPRVSKIAASPPSSTAIDEEDLDSTLVLQSKNVIFPTQPFGRLYSIAIDSSYILPPNPTCIIGRRSPANNIYPDIDLSNQGEAGLSVSRQHARITIEEDQIFIEDLNSSNSTQLNGQQLIPGKRYIIQNGDMIQLGAVLLTYISD
jgi:hypothetical protein